jgi:hypothetical protein
MMWMLSASNRLKCDITVFPLDNETYPKTEV